jgi:signal transduction histidine kinase
MKTRSIIFYWVLLLAPTLIISLAVLRMLSHEQERIDRLARETAADRARAVAESIQISVLAARNDIAREMERIPEDKLVETLTAWEETNPLIRNVFVKKPGKELVYPPKGPAATAEERRFVERYAALFSGRVPWKVAQSDAQQPSASAQRNFFNRPASVNDSPNANAAQGRRDVLQQTRQTQTQSLQMRLPNAPMVAPREGGWIPWFSENRLHILGWMRIPTSGVVYGIELELMALLSRIITGFPTTAPENTLYAFLDGEGRILHQAGDATIETDLKPDLGISLAPQLPHWQVGVFFMGEGPAGESGRAFFLLTALLLGIFIAAIAAGGGLLTWQALRNMKDAMQKTTFVSNVSHELKTPLTSIRMYAELLSEDRVKDPEKKRRYLNVIVDESQRLTRLVNNVLDFSRLEQGRKKYHPEELDLVELLHDVTNAQALRLSEAGMELKMELSEVPVPITADRDALEQVFLNVLDNAVKYAAGGGEAAIELTRSDERCEMRIMDRGPGIPPEHRNAIFEKFHRVDDSLTARQPGSGLGLTIARRILKDHDGDLTYEPREGGGSVFVISLPHG